MTVGKPDKQAIARAFSRAAERYDEVASFQRDCGHQLWTLLTEDTAFDAGLVRRCIDVGCGTGYFSELLSNACPQAQCFGLDLAAGMVSQAKVRNPKVGYVLADAEQLPFQDSTYDLYFGNLALQWSQDLSAWLAEAHRVLAPGGFLALTSLADGTLEELRSAWTQVDEQVHVNQFLSPTAIKEQVTDSPLDLQQLQTADIIQQYDSVKIMARELKQLGAYNLNPGRPQGLSSRRRLSALEQAYESYRNDQGLLPATYRVVYLIMRKAHAE